MLVQLSPQLARQKNRIVRECFLYNSFGRNGWIVPNQYWSPGVLSPMPIMGKYYMHYGAEFYPPRELERKNALRFKAELILDNLGMCRFHRAWAEDMSPAIIEFLFNAREHYLHAVATTAARIACRNASIFWETGRCSDFIYTFLKRKNDVEDDSSPELLKWLDAFRRDKREAALTYWYEIHKGIHESLQEL